MNERDARFRLTAEEGIARANALALELDRVITCHIDSLGVADADQVSCMATAAVHALRVARMLDAQGKLGRSRLLRGVMGTPWETVIDDVGRYVQGKQDAIV